MLLTFELLQYAERNSDGTITVSRDAPESVVKKFETLAELYGSENIRFYSNLEKEEKEQNSGD